MAERLARAAKATEADLKSNPQAGDAREALETLAEAYQAISEVLELLPELAQRNDAETYSEQLEIAQDAREAVLDTQLFLQELLGGEEKLCPRCSGQDDDQTCPDCGLTLLYPDPKTLQPAPLRSAVLSPGHAGVYQAYRCVVRGEDDLSCLEPALVQLEQSFQKLEQLLGQLEEKTLIPTIQAELQTGRRGIERMDGVRASLRIAELNRGWDEIFSSALAIQSLLQGYASESGIATSSDDQIQLLGDC